MCSLIFSGYVKTANYLTSRSLPGKLQSLKDFAWYKSPKSSVIAVMADEIDSTIKVKWYSTIFLLVGTILAVADPVTDILTLGEFYLNDHKTWFGVGLVFVILPSLVISCLYYRWHYLKVLFLCWCRGIFKTDHEVEDAIKEVFSTPDLLFGWNLLALPYKRLQAFILCSRNFKKLWHETLEEDCDKKIKNLIYDETWLGMFQAILESAP